MTVLVGGVSELFQRDLDLGRLAVERLRIEDLGTGVTVEDLHYGAVAVAQRLQELEPDVVILVGAVERGRPPGTVEVRPGDKSAGRTEVHAAMSAAITGYVGIDLVLLVADGFGVLPPETVVVEVEPTVTGPSPELSADAEDALERVSLLVRSEIAARLRRLKVSVT